MNQFQSTALPESAEAWGQFDLGNYAAAYLSAGGGDSRIEALATIMCGAVGPGLDRHADWGLETPADRLFRAYGLWCMDAGSAAADCLTPLDGTPLEAPGRQLRDAIGRRSLDVVLFSMPGGGKWQAFQEIAGFRVFPVSLTPAQFGIGMAEVLAGLPDDADPVMAISMDAYGVYLPRDIGSSGLPLVVWVSDHDYFLATRFDDLAAATVIVVNSAQEHAEIARVYETRVASFPGHESYNAAAADAEPSDDKRYDILFTGRAFVPYMADKARFLAAIATDGDPAAEIAIIDEYLDADAYAAALAAARHVPLYWRYRGGIQTRAIDALGHGAFVISPEPQNCGQLLGGAAAGFFRMISSAIPSAR